MFHLMQELMNKNEWLEQKLDKLQCQNQRLEDHVREIKASIQLRQDVPPQILLQQPVILHDAIGRIAPFHLEFISSAAAFTAVLKVRFQHRGQRKIMAQEWTLREARKQNTINIDKPWETVFLVSPSPYSC
jgi:hypothetical protein